MPTIIFKETEACNSNCIYCDVIARKKPETITQELLQLVYARVNEYLLKYPEETFEIIWHGGEPCIVGVDFYKNVLKIVDKECPNTKDRIRYNIQSNLTLINQGFLDVFKEMGISMIGTSYEPYKGIRGFGKQRDSDAYNRKFFEGLELLEKNNLGWGFIYVVTKNVLNKPLEVFNILSNFSGKNNSFDLHPVYSYKNEDKNNVGITAEEFADFLGVIFKEWWEHRERYPRVDPFDTYLEHYNKTATGLVCTRTNCALSHIYIGPTGKISHCGRASEWDAFESGNIKDMTIEEVFNLPYRKELLKRDELLKETECKGCKYFSFCAGGCPLDGWNSTGDFMKKSEWCNSEKYFLQTYFEPITKLNYQYEEN